jgi:alpha-tubulin suppressor-like RCC1 family protein
LALGKTGFLYSWGESDIGRPIDETRFTPTQIKVIKNVIKICSGDSYSIILTKDGSAFSFGTDPKTTNDEPKCLLGHGSNNSTIIEPTIINALTGVNVCLVSTGFDLSLFVTTEGVLYSCGHQKKRGRFYGNILPTIVNGIDYVTSVSSSMLHDENLIISRGAVFSFRRDYDIKSYVASEIRIFDEHEEVNYIYSGQQNFCVIIPNKVMAWHTDSEESVIDFQKVMDLCAWERNLEICHDDISRANSLLPIPLRTLAMREIGCVVQKRRFNASKNFISVVP